MERIYISSEIEEICNDYSSNLFLGKNSRFQKPKERLKNLASQIWHAYRSHVNDAIPWDKYFLYVRNIIKYYDDIICLKPSEFDSYQTNYFSHLTTDELQLKILNNNSFYENIVWAMRYDSVRDTEYAPYIRKLGIKACVYCNAQFSLPTHGKGNNKVDITTYEIDHYYPKSVYPFLCITFYNLAPSCGPCNRRKNDKHVKFCLYSELNDSVSLYPFHFILNLESVAEYLITTDKNTINFTLEANDELLNSHKVFHLDAIYDEHKDVAEELVWKHKIYSVSYRNAVMTQFKDLFNMGDEECYRLLFGTYPVTDHIHKRPLSLFMRDISEKLDEIFDSEY